MTPIKCWRKWKSEDIKDYIKFKNEKPRSFFLNIFDKQKAKQTFMLYTRIGGDIWAYKLINC